MSLISCRPFPRHSHDQLGIGVITSGGHRSWSSIGSVDAVSGDMIMVNPGEMHDGIPTDGNARSWKMLFFEPVLAYAILAEEGGRDTVTLKPSVRDRNQAIRFSRLFAAVTGPKPDDLLIEQCLMQTLPYAFQHHGSERPVPLPSLPGVQRVIRYIDAAPERSLSLREMAAMANASRFHFLRGFARATGATPHAYLVQRRVRLARRLLAAGKEPGRASTEAGFADQSHMTRAFVRQLGMTPGRYRQVVYGAKSRAISFKTERRHSQTICT